MAAGDEQHASEQGALAHAADGHHTPVPPDHDGPRIPISSTARLPLPICYCSVRR